MTYEEELIHLTELGIQYAKGWIDVHLPDHIDMNNAKIALAEKQWMLKTLQTTPIPITQEAYDAILLALQNENRFWLKMYSHSHAGVSDPSVV